jgi:hypothetical protein
MKQVGNHVELTAEEARQGRIVLTTPLRVAIFMIGLAGLVAAAFFLMALPSA